MLVLMWSKSGLHVKRHVCGKIISRAVASTRQKSAVCGMHSQTIKHFFLKKPTEKLQLVGGKPYSKPRGGMF